MRKTAAAAAVSTFHIYLCRSYTQGQQAQMLVRACCHIPIPIGWILLSYALSSLHSRIVPVFASISKSYSRCSWMISPSYLYTPSS